MTTMLEVITTVHNPDVRRLLSLAVQEVTDRARAEEELAARRAAEQRSAYAAVQGACTAALAGNLRPYVGRLITGAFHIPPRHFDTAELEIHLPDIEIPLRARFAFAGESKRRTEGEWHFEEYRLPGLCRTHSPAGAAVTYGWDEHLAARAFSIDDALAYLVQLVADFRTQQATVAGAGAGSS